VARQEQNRRAARLRQATFRQKVADIKLERGCETCGYSKCAAALDFHHRDKLDKEFTISQAIDLSWERIEAEIEKCDVLCRNCHAEEHHCGPV